MTVNISSLGGAGWQFFDANGNPLSGGLLYTYAAGTVTPQTTYTSSSGNVTNTNPIVLDAAGRVANEIWLTDSVTYKFMLKTSTGVEIWTKDNIPGITASAAFNDFSQPNGSSLIGYIQGSTGSVATTVQAKLRQTISVKDFGAVGNGVTDDTNAILAALAALAPGGSLYFPAGTYIFKRGTGTLIADTIVADNIIVYGDGGASIIKTYNGVGTIPNNVGNQYYNVFQATNRNNITIRDLSFQGYCSPVCFIGCNNISINNIYDNAQLTNANAYLRDKSLYLHKCTNVRVYSCKFINAAFAVYISGDAIQATTACIVTNCNFEITTAAGSYTALFPVGVYWFYSKDCVVANNTFKNIYSSLDNGSSGTGMGYGVYEGDGLSSDGIISNNTFVFEAYGLKNATGIYLNDMSSCVVSGNSFNTVGAGRLIHAIRLDAKTSDCNYAITGNNIALSSTLAGCFGIYITGVSTTYAPFANISGNTIVNGTNAIRVDSLPLGVYSLSNNVLRAQSGSAINVIGSSTNPIKNIKIDGNFISKPGANGIYLGYCVSAYIVANQILDGNTSAATGDNGAGILFTSNSYGSFIANNVIGNTAYDNGLFTYGVQNTNLVTDRIFKDITVNNSFPGLANNFQYGRYWTSSPTNGISNVNKGDFIANVQLGASQTPGWYCVIVLKPTLTADASSASTTVTVSSTANFAAGDIVLLQKSANLYTSGGYYTATQWHVDTVASITDATRFVLTTGISAGDGIYSAGVATVTVARFKAAAVIAA